MNDFTSAEANRLKAVAGKKLDEQLNLKFTELVDEGVISNFEQNVNFKEKGYAYEKQYLANFILETFDNQFIIISSSTSYRQDRFKLQQYNIRGVQENADIADRIIASIILYPDDQSVAPGFQKLVTDLDNKVTFSSATHVFLLSELLEFIVNHKAEVEQERAELEQEKSEEELEEEKAEEAEEVFDLTKSLKSKKSVRQHLLELGDLSFESEPDPNNVSESTVGSVSGKAGNKLERDITEILNRSTLLTEFKTNNAQSSNKVFDIILDTISKQHSINILDIIDINATNSITKLRKGGSAKTDILVTIETNDNVIIETISVKNTQGLYVSCHDYNASDFLRVLDCESSKLGEYFKMFQSGGSHKGMEALFPSGYSKVDFETLLSPQARMLTEWATTGQHDTENLIFPEKQISNFLFIRHTKNNTIRFVNYNEYIDELFTRKNKTYGVPLLWTRSSKDRIQFKLPIKI